MLRNSKGFSGFSVKDLTDAKKFYGEVLGLEVHEDSMGLMLRVAGGNGVFVYQKDDHQPATYTILNFPVDDIDEAVKELKGKSVTFEHYEGMTDEGGVARGLSHNMGPDIAWFKDPSGNILAILQQE
jgi:predicted enzyme related to lactoylglutathione lyase